ncbi:hypothetical protein HYFRA_00007332 [Hymenoscyphus fraxineus]|uniref:Uncharacterized protein n=1 Tax=Hymenoscyphus fraxineus TaxID=746836 RepID=A0A9N9KTS6_9HELO|nr:hypothetical protein HYFRA_00007332 [Hymenoscyphus fraxineus]
MSVRNSPNQATFKGRQNSQISSEAPPNLNGKEFKKNTKPRRSTLPGEFLATATRPKYKLTYFLDDLSIQFKQAIQAPSKTRSDKVQLTSRGQLESKPPACQHAIRVPVVCSLSTNMPSVHDEHARVSDFGSMWVLVLHLFSFSSENGIRRQIRVHGILKALLACESRTLDLDLRDYVLVDANAQI